eukprot:355307-Chlamydomonas_euryale.AAC.3
MDGWMCLPARTRSLYARPPALLAPIQARGAAKMLRLAPPFSDAGPCVHACVRAPPCPPAGPVRAVHRRVCRQPAVLVLHDCHPDHMRHARLLLAPVPQVRAGAACSRGGGKCGGGVSARAAGARVLLLQPGRRSSTLTGRCQG